ncbi:hypothetical protein UY416_07135 [Paenibacillus polymyxa]|uniref:hypothetical protein n=1 Tax=Paenibacillus TaxID=44249 RepID=UPI002AB563AF|nr:hypothetical protein [Paenibacillus polymyxa]MDY8046064.1 hypothetical protein [Paenibacillus polymyxa]
MSTFTARNLAMWQQLGTQITAGETASVFNWSDAMTRQKLLTALPKLLVTST